MLESCGKHPHEMGVALCRRCGQSWCSNCLVYSFGPKKPPFCMSCAMVAGGVRTQRRPARHVPQAAQGADARTEGGGQGRRQGRRAAEPKEPSRRPTAAFTETDWSTPWWEDRQPAALAD